MKKIIFANYVESTKKIRVCTKYEIFSRLPVRSTRSKNLIVRVRGPSTSKLRNAQHWLLKSHEQILNFLTIPPPPPKNVAVLLLLMPIFRPPLFGSVSYLSRSAGYRVIDLGYLFDNFGYLLKTKIN